MAALFLDSSALVIQELGSAWVTGLTTSTAGNWLYVARVTGVEVVSGIARKARADCLSAADASQAFTSFRADFPGAFTVVDVTPTLVSEAMHLAETHVLHWLGIGT